VPDPVQINCTDAFGAMEERIAAIGAGGSHSIVLSDTGKLAAWGRNSRASECHSRQIRHAIRVGTVLGMTSASVLNGTILG